ncbi:MAG: DUF523 domain-containing protein [Dehalobacterium sp.]
MIMISACLLGANCKYSGGNNKNPQLISLLKDKNVIPVCPEELGGLTTPREPAEIINGTGLEVLQDKAKICAKDGTDITKYFLKGAKKIKEIAESHHIDLAIMKERSPSCGVDKIYDGSFQGKVIPGSGVSTTLLKKMGISVISEETPLTNDILALLNKNK